MKRHTVRITIPGDLEPQVDALLAEQDGEEKLASLMEDALREHLERPLILDGKEYRFKRPFRLTPLEEKDDQGEPDVSINHDKYLAEP